MEQTQLLGYLLKIMTFPALLLALGVTAFYAKRWIDQRGGNRPEKRFIQVLATKRLTPKANISIVKIAGAILVVGVNNERISLLTEIDEQKLHTEDP